ncbi:hypothetical protein [Treponema endosymbiont of Eucomonympha sp.]|uniref:hypothetical protein n=1 Tax=Treponema endosymbiont of Eucomonympha sp. TaxID=1580831 RepID=UPI0013969740|nr:hypothetical protein [Treponema endosymbiont of Eucomonympha sp.]
MNVARRFLTATAVTIGALGIGAGAFVACRQEPVPGVRNASAGAERRAPDAKYNDGHYDFYFKNYAHAGGDCDGYSSEPGGKTTIYEWSQSEITKWEKRLLARRESSRRCTAPATSASTAGCASTRGCYTASGMRAAGIWTMSTTTKRTF